MRWILVAVALFGSYWLFRSCSRRRSNESAETKPLRSPLEQDRISRPTNLPAQVPSLIEGQSGQKSSLPQDLSSVAQVENSEPTNHRLKMQIEFVGQPGKWGWDAISFSGNSKFYDLPLEKRNEIFEIFTDPVAAFNGVRFQFTFQPFMAHLGINRCEDGQVTSDSPGVYQSGPIVGIRNEEQLRFLVTTNSGGLIGFEFPIEKMLIKKIKRPAYTWYDVDEQGNWTVQGSGKFWDRTEERTIQPQCEWRSNPSF